MLFDATDQRMWKACGASTPAVSVVCNDVDRYQAGIDISDVTTAYSAVMASVEEVMRPADIPGLRYFIGQVPPESEAVKSLNLHEPLANRVLKNIGDNVLNAETSATECGNPRMSMINFDFTRLIRVYSRTECGETCPRNELPATANERTPQ